MSTDTGLNPVRDVLLVLVARIVLCVVPLLAFVLAAVALSGPLGFAVSTAAWVVYLMSFMWVWRGVKESVRSVWRWTNETRR